MRYTINKLKVAAAVALAMGLTMSNSWALTEDEAMSKVATLVSEVKALEQSDRAQIRSMVNQLIESGVPADQAYVTAETCVAQGIQGKSLVQLNQDIQTQIAKGADASAAVEVIMGNIESYQTAGNGSGAGNRNGTMREALTDPTSADFCPGSDDFGGGAGMGDMDAGSGPGGQ